MNNVSPAAASHPLGVPSGGGETKPQTFGWLNGAQKLCSNELTDNECVRELGAI